jgi:hypothetical protein
LTSTNLFLGVGGGYIKPTLSMVNLHNPAASGVELLMSGAPENPGDAVGCGASLILKNSTRKRKTSVMH